MIFIYLDFDGVLNNESGKEIEQLFRYDQDCGTSFFDTGSASGSVYHALHKLSVANIFHMKRALHWLTSMQPRIVISSSWRRTMNFEEMQSLLSIIGIDPLWLHSFTKEAPDSLGLNFPDRRAFEIREHMRYHGLKMHEIAIIDDMRLFDLGVPEQERFIHVSCWTGFDAAAAHQLIWMFKPNWKLRPC